MPAALKDDHTPTMFGFGVLLLAILGGAAVGGMAGRLVGSGDSDAVVLGAVAPPLSFFLGMAGWLAVATGASLARWGRGIARGRPLAETRREVAAADLAGAGAFLPASVLTWALAGILVGLVSPASVLAATAVFAVLGAGYGLTLTRMAGRRLLPLLIPDG
jgi:hypothetical protein